MYLLWVLWVIVQYIYIIHSYYIIGIGYKIPVENQAFSVSAFSGKLFQFFFPLKPSSNYFEY